jgi:hypothetical protein
VRPKYSVVLPVANLEGLIDGVSGSVAVGVGPSDDPDSLALVRCPCTVSTHHDRPAGVAFRLQAIEHDIRPANTEDRWVLSEHPSRSGDAHDSQELEPQARPWASYAFAFARRWDVLAREASWKDIDSSK